MVSGTRDNPPHRVTLGGLPFHLFLRKDQRTVYARDNNSSRGGKTTRGGGGVVSPRQVG